jgi:hypothetical protein
VTVACPPQLRTLYRQGRLVPFIGAGVSVGVEWEVDGDTRRGPTWSELVNRAAEIIGFAEPELLRVRGTDLQILEYFRIKRHGSIGDLTQWLTNYMHPPDDELENSRVHAAIAALDRCPVIYTTNFDDFIERALALHGTPCTPISMEGHIADALERRSRDGSPPVEVVKFHGDLKNPETLVLSESDYERRLKLEEALDQRFRSDLLGRAVLFLGYSFRDWNVAYLFRLVNETFKDLPGTGLGHRAYITVPNPSDFEYRLFRARNIEVIPIDGAKATDEIVALLEQLQGA